jgi:hypothetical protein
MRVAYRGWAPVRNPREWRQCLIGTEDLGPGARWWVISNAARREHRAYKYMHIYLWTTLTLRFLEVGSGSEGGVVFISQLGVPPDRPTRRMAGKRRTSIWRASGG